MKLIFTLIAFLFINLIHGQDYFPPDDGNWQTVDPLSLGWCEEKIDTLLAYLEARNSKSFIILMDGRIALEAYFDDHNQASLWYWASAGKTITALLTGVALEDGQLELDDPVSQYIGEGWTSCDSEDELQRKIIHQLTMTSSFNNSIFLWDCTEPDCYQCTGAEVGSEWHYHNGVYRRLFEVIESATGMSRNAYTNEKLESIIGMNGFWTENLYWSTARDMARFGLLALNDFVWDGTPVLNNSQYAQDMIIPSQELNQAYGYLWWLNGQDSYMTPLDPTIYEGWLIPSAPEDLFAGLGANDQKVYVIPSQNMVVIRQGNEAYEGTPALSGFDDELWQLISDLSCDPLSINNEQKEDLIVYPNPSKGNLYFSDSKPKTIRIYNSLGALVGVYNVEDFLEVKLEPAVYNFHVRYESHVEAHRVLITE